MKIPLGGRILGRARFIGGPGTAAREQRERQGEEMEEGAKRLIYEVGDIVKLKKSHPCGSSEWEILRVGADFRLKCLGCGHQIMIARRLVEKNTRGLRKKA